MSGAKTLKRTMLGRRELRLAIKDDVYFGMADGRICTQGIDAEDVWRRLHQECGRADPRYFGYDGARSRFLRFFPGGFRAEGYLKEERDYKVRAKQRLDAAAPVSRALQDRLEPAAVCLSSVLRPWIERNFAATRERRQRKCCRCAMEKKRIL